MTETVRKPTSRLMRMTDEDRPFTRVFFLSLFFIPGDNYLTNSIQDFKDLFSTLMVSLDLGAHRVRFFKVDFTFTVEEAIINLSSLRFTQSARMPDPKDPNRIITTTSTTTFTMAKEMARSIFQSFIEARFLEPLNSNPFSVSKSTVCQMTPKGIAVLHRFCNRNGVTAVHVTRLLQSPRNKMTLLILERDLETDKLLTDRATIEVIFRRFAGTQACRQGDEMPNWEDRTDCPNGLVGVEGVQETRVNGRKYQYAFTGKSAVNWLMDCCTTIDERETYRLCTQFIEHGLITNIVEDKSYAAETGQPIQSFQPTRQAVYALTPRAMRVCGWVASDQVSDDSSKSKNSKSNSTTLLTTSATGTDISNTSRLNYILTDPSLRLLFREFLGASFCEENLSFYLDVTEYLDNYNRSKLPDEPKDSQKLQDHLASAFGLYNAFLAPGSPCELNIDHSLRNRVAAKMTGLGGDGPLSTQFLEEVVGLFRLAQSTVFKLMASDSVPKFFRHPRYALILQEHDFESISSLPSRASSPIGMPMRSPDRPPAAAPTS
ncbi:Developmental regulator flbA [Talaromyces atroroseus]|uniref:Developmental regulator flbA n=1 Tax=Talaromyces atroroseus TaxID=1441469 RepID=A0A225AWB3_TALAT|nr:Developmental regulator flbA [Talaromyces atroroseus]OKL59909.1 Developmental regulator flbA [Talaromyces atroroseus]